MSLSLMVWRVAFLLLVAVILIACTTTEPPARTVRPLPAPQTSSPLESSPSYVLFDA